MPQSKALASALEPDGSDKLLRFHVTKVLRDNCRKLKL